MKKETAFDRNRATISKELKQKLKEIYFKYYYVFLPKASKEQLIRQVEHTISLVKQKDYGAQILKLKKTIREIGHILPRGASDPVFENPFTKRKYNWLAKKKRK